MRGYVVNEHAVPGRTEPGDTAETRLTIDANVGCELLEARVIRFAPGRSAPRALGDRQEILYVASGRGTISVGGAAHEVEPDTGVYLAPGETYEVQNSGPETLKVVSVTAPEHNGSTAGARRTVRWADQPSLPATPNREFRYLVNQDIGCLDVTQFVGAIPPGRASMHSHTYDEVVYVVEGEGVLHLGGRDTPLAPGSMIHLPPLEEHCLENTGPTPMRVLGVFHPSGDPASRASVAKS